MKTKTGSNGLLVMDGPKLIGDFYYRIVSHYGGPYRVERYDPKAGAWSTAPKNVMFNDVCNAQTPSDWLQRLLQRTKPPAEPGGAAR
jgi:hypothetical protein